MPKRPAQNQPRQNNANARKKMRQPDQQDVWIRSNGSVWVLARDQKTGLRRWIRIR